MAPVTPVPPTLPVPATGELGCLGGAVVGFGLGALGAIVIDAAVLAYEEPSEQPPGPRISPMGQANAHGGQLGLMGRF